MMQSQSHLFQSSLEDSVNKIDSNDLSQVIEGLNGLLKMSYERTDLGSAISLDKHPKIILGLASLMETINPIGPCFGEYCRTHGLSSTHAFIASSETAWMKTDNSWTRRLTVLADEQFLDLALVVDESPIMLNTLAIIRNMSFEVSNEFTLASSSFIMRHAVALLLASLTHRKGNDSGQMAFDTLVNIGTRIDLTGRKRLQHHTYLENVTELCADAHFRSMFHMRLSNHFSSTGTQEYTCCTSMLLPLISHVLEHQQVMCRSYICSAVELLGKLAQSVENTFYLQEIPIGLLGQLVELMYSAHTRSDIMKTQGDGGLPQEKEKKEKKDGAGGASSNSSNGFGANSCDYELRDLVLECLHALCLSAVDLQLRLGEVPRAVHTLYRISVVTTSNTFAASHMQATSRTDGNHRASQVLALLLAQPTLSRQFYSLRTDLFLSASCEEAQADIVCNKALPAYSILNVVDVVAPEESMKT